MRRILVFTAIALLAGAAFATGESWRYQVLEFQRGEKNKATVVLKALEPLEKVPGQCETLTVAVDLDPEPPFKRTWSKDIVTRTTHSEALDFLAKASSATAEIRFGRIGAGLAFEEGTPCVARTKGLAVLFEPDGSQAVYAFHDPI